MQATEFAYWLQGYFEINVRTNSLSGDEPAVRARSLTEAQAKAVFKKAESVEAGPGEAEAKAKAFADYTKAFLSPVVTGVSTPEFLRDATESLRTKLNYLFVHAIDPSYEGDQTQFGKIHKPGNDGPIMRC